MEILSTIFYFIITIGVLVLVHEFGHFIAAICSACAPKCLPSAWAADCSAGTRRPDFPSEHSQRDLDLEGNTDYRVSLFPIGGYVKIAGMIDESLDTEFFKHEPQPWEFRSKPIWKRAVVLSAGVMMNVILAIVIFWGIIYYQGRDIRPVTEIGYIAPGSPAEKFGLRVSDKILALNDKPVKQWDEIESSLYTESVGQRSDIPHRTQRSRRQRFSSSVPLFLILPKSVSVFCRPDLFPLLQQSMPLSPRDSSDFNRTIQFLP